METVFVSFSRVPDHYNNTIALKMRKTAEPEAQNRNHGPPQEKEQTNPNGHNSQIRIPDTTHVHFIRYPKIDDYFIQIVDDKTNKVIREIPPKKVRDVYISMMERFVLNKDKKGKVE